MDRSGRQVRWVGHIDHLQHQNITQRSRTIMRAKVHNTLVVAIHRATNEKLSFAVVKINHSIKQFVSPFAAEYPKKMTE